MRPGTVASQGTPPRRDLRALTTCLVWFAAACGPPNAQPADLLHGRPVSHVRGMQDAARITDGRVPDEGAAWRSEETSVGRGSAAFVEFDLGSVQQVRAAWLQADHNDRYVVSVSRDGRDFAVVWEAPEAVAGGLRARFRRALDAEGRFVRIAPLGGDGLYSLSEARLYAVPPSVWPPVIARVQPAAPNAPLRSSIGWGCVGLCLLVAGVSTRMPGWVRALGAAFAVVAAGVILRHGVALFPLDILSESAIRAAVALVAAVCVVRLGGADSRWPPHRPLVLAALGACGLIAFASFFHFGRAQFHDDAGRRPSHVHYLDMRVYFPAAKYAEELGFDGVYAASVAALADMEGGDRALARLDDVLLRDLRNHRVMPVRAVRDHLVEVRARFGDRRWAEFVRDMRYFRDAMGRSGYVASLLDHGGNATPVWLTHAHWLFRDRVATHTLLVATGLLDPLLLFAAFVAIAWCFGPVAAFVSMLVFGANDFHMGGYTNWAGATLRHDWMAMLAFGLCALRRDRHLLGGALLALAAFLRAFPVFAFVGIAATMLLWVVQERRETGAWPSWTRLRSAQAPALGALTGAALASAVLLAVSSAVLGAGAWAGWMHKVRLLSSEPRVNHMGLKALFYYDFERDLRAASERALSVDWVAAQERAFASRAPLYYVAAVALTGLVVFACRRQPPVRAALLGLVLFVVWLYPANYYMHFVFVVPLLADAPVGMRGFSLSRAATGTWTVLCLMCAAQYASVIEPYHDRHYFIGSVCLMTALVTAVVLASPELRYFFFSIAARARSRARMRSA